MSPEQAFWRQIVTDLQVHFTLEYIAEEMDVTPRQVSNWKNGDRPIGLTAINLVRFHDQHRNLLPSKSP